MLFLKMISNGVEVWTSNYGMVDTREVIDTQSSQLNVANPRPL